MEGRTDKVEATKRQIETMCDTPGKVNFLEPDSLSKDSGKAAHRVEQPATLNSFPERGSARSHLLPCPLYRNTWNEAREIMGETRTFRLSRSANVVLAEANQKATRFGISIQGGVLAGTITGKATGSYRVLGAAIDVTLDANNTGFPDSILWSALRGFLEK